MDAGDADATKGMTKAIYDAIHVALYPKLSPPQPTDASDYRTKVEDGWRQLAFAVATGAVSALTAAPTGSPLALVVSSSTDDGAYWTWLHDFVDVFQTKWAPTTPDGLALQAALKTFITTNNRPVPTSLKGSLK